MNSDDLDMIEDYLLDEYEQHDASEDLKWVKEYGCCRICRKLFSSNRFKRSRTYKVGKDHR